MLKIVTLKRSRVETWYLLLIVFTLLYFSEDGILFFGSIPTYLILLGLIVKAFASSGFRSFVIFENFFILFLLSISLSVLFAPTTVQLSHIQSYVLMFLTYFYARSVSYDANLPKYFLWLFFVFLFTNLSLMTIQLLTANPIYFFGTPSYLIPTGFFVDQHKNAFTILICYSFTQSYLIGTKQILGSVIFLFLILAFLLVSSSRAGLLVWFLITIYIYAQNMTRSYFVIFLIIILLAVIGGYLMTDWDSIYRNIYDLLPPGFELGYESAIMKYSAFFTDDSGAERIMLWSNIYDLDMTYLLRLPIFGIGPGTIDNLYSQTMHNTFIDILVSTGVLGFFSISLIIVNILKHELFNIRTLYGFALNSVVVSIALFSLMHDFGRARYLWLFLGLLAFHNYRASRMNH